MAAHPPKLSEKLNSHVIESANKYSKQFLTFFFYIVKDLYKNVIFNTFRETTYPTTAISMKKEKLISRNEKDLSEPHAYVHFVVFNKIRKKASSPIAFLCEVQF